MASKIVTIPKLVDDSESKRTKHVSLYKQSKMQGKFALCGNSASVEAQPSIIHFSDIEPGKRITRRIRILNKSPEKVILQFEWPASTLFQIAHEKKGPLYPGMFEEIVISFTATHWRYYYDTIKCFVNTGETIFVPLHAYPSLSSVSFPKKLDFGVGKLAVKKTKTVKLSSASPAAFEFKIQPMDKNDVFEITPMSGIIPAHGDVEISISFIPIRYTTYFLDVQVQLQYYSHDAILGEPKSRPKKSSKMARKTLDETLLDQSQIERVDNKEEVVTERRIQRPILYQHGCTPSFMEPMVNYEWEFRSHLVQTFLGHLWKTVIRHRVQSRLNAKQRKQNELSATATPIKEANSCDGGTSLLEPPYNIPSRRISKKSTLSNMNILQVAASDPEDIGLVSEDNLDATVNVVDEERRLKLAELKRKALEATILKPSKVKKKTPDSGVPMKFAARKRPTKRDRSSHARGEAVTDDGKDMRADWELEALLQPWPVLEHQQSSGP